MRKTSSLKKLNNRRKIVASTPKATRPKSRSARRAQSSVKGLRSEIRLRHFGAKQPKARRKLKTERRQVAGLSSKVIRKPPKTQFDTRKAISANPLRLASIRQYEAAVRLLYAQNFQKAKSAFEKLIQTFGEDKEVLERAKSHLRLCEQRIARKPPAPRTVEDLYNAAVALMNEGKYQESIEHLNKALKNSPDCDYVLYALAASHCLTGNFDGALSNLKSAITLKPENRFLAQHDYDFEPLTQDSRFISIVFPERAIAPPQ
jgi:tetratricopeptide (TPR) repeat protein